MKRGIVWLLILVLFATLCGGCSNLTKKIEHNIDQFCMNNNFSGSILIADNGKILLKKSYGMADYEKKIPNTPQTIFRLASVSKQFTATCIMMLEERGLLSVNDPVNKYIPDYPNGDIITLHHLLTHTSGIPEYFTDLNNLDHYFTPGDIIRIFKDRPLEFAPGARFKYSNSNYILLGYIIEEVSHMKYEDFVKRNIFEPLGMNDSGYDHNEEMPNKAVGYESINNPNHNPEYKKAVYIDMSYPYAAGALRSTVEDLYKWDQALYTEKILKQETLARMFTGYPNGENIGIPFGYGWVIDKPGEKPWVSHQGELPGFRSYIFRDTKLRRTVIILCNYEFCPMAREFDRLVLFLYTANTKLKM